MFQKVKNRYTLPKQDTMLQLKAEINVKPITFKRTSKMLSLIEFPEAIHIKSIFMF